MRVETFGVLVAVAVAAAITAFVLATQGCASLSAYEQAHPDVIAKAVAAVELANCVDTAVSKYNKAQASKAVAALDAGSPRPLDPNPYVDAGTSVPAWYEDGGHQ